MSTKSIFDFALPLTRAALLRLMKGEHVEGRGSPPGATMIEGVAKAKLHAEITEAERRAICDVLTRDVPNTYAGGYAIASWGDNAPVVGTTEWLTMIASNADRIPIKVQTGPNTWESVYLADASLDQQKDALRTWLEAGMTPTWEKHALTVPLAEKGKTTGPADVAADALSKTRVAFQGPTHTIHLDTASAEELDLVGKHIGLARNERWENGRCYTEDDASYRQRLAIEMENARRATMPLAPPAPKPPPFKAPSKTPKEEAIEKIGLVRWIAEQSYKVGSEWHLNSREKEFLKSVEMRVRMGELPTDKQAQWLNDLHSTARQKASTISHLLPPIPKFT